MKFWGAVLLLSCLCLVAVTQAKVEGPNRALKRTSCACGGGKKGRIVGGSEVKNGYPWIVMLAGKLKGKWLTFCGASIVNEKVAITAAHCMIGFEKRDQLAVIAGTANVKKSAGQLVPLAKYVQHPQYNGRKDVNDIALLFLVKPLVFNQNVQPVCLPTGKINLDNKWVKMAGWGAVGGGEEDPEADTLMDVDLQIVPNAVCKKWHPGLATPQTQICAKAPGKGGCHGDSGGPAVYLDPETQRYTLVGLVSFGDPDCKTDIPTVCTEVSKYLPWISSAANTLGCHKI